MAAFSTVPATGAVRSSIGAWGVPDDAMLIDSLTAQIEQVRLTGTSTDTQVRFQSYSTTYIREPGVVTSRPSIQTILNYDLSNGKQYEVLTPLHKAFDSARRFVKNQGDYTINDIALDNFLWLASGDLRYPIILLLNPSDDHESERYEEKVRNGRELCSTLEWIRNALEECGLRIEDVCILDVYPLISMELYKVINSQSEYRATMMLQESLEITRSLLVELQPRIALSCQCSTVWEPWSRPGDPMLTDLCSTRRKAHQGVERTVYVGNHRMDLALGMHPWGFLRNSSNSSSPSEDEQLIKALFRKIYRPCAVFKRNLERMAFEQLEESYAGLQASEKALRETLNFLEEHIKTSKLNSTDRTMKTLVELKDTLNLVHTVGSCIHILRQELHVSDPSAKTKTFADEARRPSVEIEHYGTTRPYMSF